MSWGDSIDRMLLDYAAGGLCAEELLLVAALLALNTAARQRVAGYEALGGRVLEDERPADVRCLDAVMNSIGRAAPPQPQAPRLPEPLAGLLGGCTRDEAAHWRVARGGVQRLEVHVHAPRGTQRDLFLMRLAPHAALPPHRHAGPEITLVLEGGYSDGFGHYGRGDVEIIADGATVHAPRAGALGCLCLVLTHGAMRFESPLQQLLYLLTGV